MPVTGGKSSERPGESGSCQSRRDDGVVIYVRLVVHEDEAVSGRLEINSQRCQAYCQTKSGH